jgi:arsenate reductase
MELDIYSYANCGTCRNAIKWLSAASHEVRVTEITQNPPTAQQLKAMIMKSGLPLKNFFNTSGEVYKLMQLKDKLPLMTEEQQLELLASNGKLIKRPIVTDGTHVTVGFKEQDFDHVWRHS